MLRRRCSAVRKQYQSPRLVEHGRLDEVTTGAVGSSPDAAIVSGVPRVDANSPACTTSVASGYCYRF
jgi:hypothetical protein